MLAERQLALMKPSAVVINTSRGRIIDEAALARALEAGRLGAAAMDGFAEEPLPETRRCAVWRQGADVAACGLVQR